MASPISAIYEHYKIMPSLAAHQKRVAAVAMAIIEHSDMPLPTPEIISACLLHDMGNILKFDLAYFPEFTAPQGEMYWQAIRAEFNSKYGPDEHAAAIAIATELGVSDLTLSLIQSIGFSNVGAVTGSDTALEKKICSYADMRVAPKGIVSMDERFFEGRHRYEGRADKHRSDEELIALEGIFCTNEKEIFSHASSLVPNDITDALCENYFSVLENFVVV